MRADHGYIFLKDIVLEGRSRPADPVAVASIAASMKEIGQIAPIVVRSSVDEDQDRKPRFIHTDILVAGLHRYEAAKLLGWDRIACVYFQGEDENIEMWEIAENLHRADLSKNQRDEWIRRYAELLTAKRAAEVLEAEETGPTECQGSLADGRGAGPQHQAGIASQIAKEMGKSVRLVQRALNPPEKKQTVTNAEAAPNVSPPSIPAPPIVDTGVPDLPPFLDRRPKPAVVAAVVDDERGRAAEYVAERLSEFPLDQHAGIATALELAAPEIAKRFAEMSRALYGTKAA